MGVEAALEVVRFAGRRLPERGLRFAGDALFLEAAGGVDFIFDGIGRAEQRAYRDLRRRDEGAS